MTKQEVQELVRSELLAVFEAANERARQGQRGSGFGTSTTDMSVGLGTPTEYLLQVIRERMNSGGDVQDAA